MPPFSFPRGISSGFSWSSTLQDGIPPHLRVHDLRSSTYTAATALNFARPIPSHGEYLNTSKELAKPLQLGSAWRVVSPGSGRYCP